jgi:hypothetical protein
MSRCNVQYFMSPFVESQLLMHVQTLNLARRHECLDMHQLLTLWRERMMVMVMVMMIVLIAVVYTNT